MLAGRAGGGAHSSLSGPLYYGEPITDGEAERALEPAARAGRLRTLLSRDIEMLGRRKRWRTEESSRAPRARPSSARERWATVPFWLVRIRPPRSAILNDAIKQRDFWMPFAPSVLAERAADYYHKPKPVASPYMMFAFRSRPDTARGASPRRSILTISPPARMRCSSAHNPGYYRLLKEYEARTGEGILLNTSFNLHGEPMVYRASDAVDVFLRSGLEHMALGNWWVEKTAA